MTAQVCARCRHSTTEGIAPEYPAIGILRCNGYLTEAKDNVAWNGHCGLYRPAKQMQKREEFILKLQQGEMK